MNCEQHLSPCLEIKNLTKQYHGAQLPAVDDLSIVCYPGEIVGLLGHNGAGKSTTLKCITGILPYSKGEIVINGFDIAKEPVKAKRTFGYVSDKHDVFVKLTGIQYVDFMANAYGVSVADRKARLAELEDVFQLGDRIFDTINDYSHGMRQKICMMGSLIHNPKLWIMDEPMIGLRPAYLAKSERIYEGIRKTRQLYSLLLSQHQLRAKTLRQSRHHSKRRKNGRFLFRTIRMRTSRHRPGRVLPLAHGKGGKMRNHALLLKKQLLDAFPAKRSKKRLPDLTSALLMLLLTGAMVAIFVFVFSRFISTYTQIKINRVPDIAARQYEIMSMGYFVLVVVFVINGVNALCHALFENSDLSILISMPFSSSEIFLSKLTAVYLKQAVLALVCVPTLNFTFLCTTDTLNAYNGIMTFAVALLLPIIPLGIASIVVLPYYYLKRLANSHYIFVFIVMTAGMALFCWLYSYVFRFAQDLISSGKITSLFGDKTMRFILSFTKYDYPANLFANVMLARDLGKNLGILAAFIVAFAAICLLVVRAIFIKVSHSGLAIHVPHAHTRKVRFVDNSRFGSLLAKEFLLVMRTPNYAYMYFTTAAVMPVMAYYSANISVSMLAGLVGKADVSFEICTFIVILYSTLTNTFCSTNISRDGYMSMTQKILPFSPSYILGSKITFCSVVAEVSVAIAWHSVRRNRA